MELVSRPHMDYTGRERMTQTYSSLSEMELLHVCIQVGCFTLEQRYSINLYLLPVLYSILVDNNVTEITILW